MQNISLSSPAHARRLQALTLTLLFGTGSVAGTKEALPDPLAAGWQGAPVCEKLHEDPTLRLLKCSFPPGVGHERHYHPPHTGYVLSGGTMRITSGQGVRTVEVPTGSVFTNSQGIVWHEAVNVGQTTATYLMMEPKPQAR